MLLIGVKCQVHMRVYESKYLQVAFNALPAHNVGSWDGMSASYPRIKVLYIFKTSPVCTAAESTAEFPTVV